MQLNKFWHYFVLLIITAMVTVSVLYLSSNFSSANGFNYLKNTKPMSIESIPAENEPNFEYKNLGLTQIELARSLDEQNQGLMLVTNLCAECGMLFIYQNPQILNFWMKDTKSDLDIIFIDEKSSIINIAESLTEGTSGEKSTARSIRPAKYVLEIQAGKSKELGLKANDKINVNQLIENGKPFGEIFPRNES